MLSVTIAGAVQNNMVRVEGVCDGEMVTVRRLILDRRPQPLFGFIKSVTKNGVNALVVIDDVQFLSGEEAIQAVMADFNCLRDKVSECVPSMNNDFYIRNRSIATQTYNLTSESKISIFQNPGSPVLMEVDLAAFIEKPKDSSSLIMSSPVKFTLDGAVITSLEEQYTP